MSKNENTIHFYFQNNYKNFFGANFISYPNLKAIFEKILDFSKL